MLAYAVKNDSASRHIHAHGEGLRGEEELDPAVGEAALDDLLEDGEDAGVVDAEATFQQLAQLQHLTHRQFYIKSQWETETNNTNKSYDYNNLQHGAVARPKISDKAPAKRCCFTGYGPATPQVFESNLKR
jgi:hypothetical protein